MSIKSVGGVFGRNPTFKDVTTESLTVAGNAMPDASTLLVDSDIGSTVQGYDADTAKLDVAQTFTETQQIDKASAVALVVNRTTDQGDIVEIQYDGSKVGTIGRKGGALYISDIDGTGFRFESNAILMTDGGGDKAAASYSLGLGAYPIGSVFQGSGHGIYMNGGTGAANLFDDYEEGTWTPTYVPQTNSFTSITYDPETGGKYIKIGNVVHIQFVLQTDAITVGTASGGIRVGGLPFAVSANTSPTANGWASLAIGAALSWLGERPSACIARGNDSAISLSYRAAADGDTLTSSVADLDTGANKNILYVAGTYVTA